MAASCGDNTAAEVVDTEIYDQDREYEQPILMKICTETRNTDEIVNDMPPIISLADQDGNEYPSDPGVSYPNQSANANQVYDGIPYSYVSAPHLDNMTILQSGQGNGPMNMHTQHQGYMMSAFNALQQPPMMGQQPPMMGQQSPMMVRQPPMMVQQPPMMVPLYHCCGGTCHMFKGPQDINQHMDVSHTPVASNKRDAASAAPSTPPAAPSAAHPASTPPARPPARPAAAPAAAPAASPAAVYPSINKVPRTRRKLSPTSTASAEDQKTVENLVEEFKGQYLKKLRLTTKTGKHRVTSAESKLMGKIYNIISRPSLQLCGFIAEQLEIDVEQVRTWFYRHYTKDVRVAERPAPPKPPLVDTIQDSDAPVLEKQITAPPIGAEEEAQETEPAASAEGEVSSFVLMVSPQGKKDRGVPLAKLTTIMHKPSNQLYVEEEDEVSV